MSCGLIISGAIYVMIIMHIVCMIYVCDAGCSVRVFANYCVLC